MNTPLLDKIAGRVPGVPSGLDLDVPGIRKLRARNMKTKQLIREMQGRGGYDSMTGKVFASALRDRGFTDEEIMEAMKRTDM